MHVLILPSWYFPVGSQAIAGRMFHQLAGGLRDQHIDARIFYPHYSVNGPMIKKRTESIEERVPTWRTRQFFPPKGNKFLLKWWRKKCINDLLRYIEEQGPPDLIHAHSYMAAYIASGMKEVTGIPFIYTERLSSFITNSIADQHLFMLDEISKTADAMTCVSPGMAAQMQQYIQRSIKIIPNFFDARIFFVDTQKEKYQKFSWVSVGEPAHTKGLDILLHAFASLKQSLPDRPMQLILIDEIPERDKLVSLAESLKIKDDLVWKGLMTQDELGQELQKCHSLVSASRVETFGKAIIEALGCGLPVVATETDGANFIMDSDQFGAKAKIDDVASLTKAMLQVIDTYDKFNPDLISDLVEKRFCHTVVIQQWSSFYKTLLS